MPRVPKLKTGSDPRALPLTAAESKLLAAIDGVVTDAELARATGLGEGAVTAALVRLRDLGAVELVESAAPAQPAKPAGPASASPLLAPSDPLPPWDPKELEEDVDLDVDKRRQILDAFHRLDRYSYYDLLGVHELCDKKQIKAAYYAVAPDFHPDKYFRKRLGAFKAKAEAIFTRLTLAHDVLTTKDRREQYDEYLDTLRRNRAAEHVLQETRDEVAAVEAAVREAANGVMASVAQAAPARAPVQARVMTDQERREALARKLLGGRKLPPKPAAPAAPAPATYEAPQVDAETMRQRYEEALAAARREQVIRFRETAMAAAERKDYAAASNAYRIAASLAPEDAELAALSEDAERMAAAALAEGFLKQAEYEVKQERWGEAAISYGKVCLGRPTDAKAHDRVALCTMKMAGGNMRRAVEFGRRAVELAPTVAEYRVTLARAYIEAGLEKSAIAELERAEELAPKDPKLKELIAQTKAQATQKKNK
jgi:tetratricopeptide (TPR) repeat protein